jgi:hypothetical protein
MLVAPQKIARLKFWLGSRRFAVCESDPQGFAAPQRDWRGFRMALIKL